MKLKKLISGVSALALALTTFGLSAYADGATLEKDDTGAYLINNIDDLKTFRDEANLGYYNGENSATGHTQVKLNADIDLENVEWTPVVISCVNFDGQNHTVSNLKVTTEGKNVGFFGKASISYVENLIIDGAKVEGINHVAAISGDGLCGHFINCTVKNAEIQTKVKDNDDGDKAGAICGYLSGESDAEVTNCKVDNVEVTGYRDCGALVGIANGTSTVTDNTVKNSTVYADYSNANYNGYKLFSNHDCNAVVGEITSNATVENNTVQNVQVIKLVSSQKQLQAAIDDDDTDAPIQLNSNIEVTEQIDVIDGKDIILDLNGYNITYTGSNELTSGVLMVRNGGTLTINDSVGTGKIESGDNAYAAIALTEKDYVIDEPATLTVNGGTFEGYYYAIVGNGGRPNTVINLNGGTFKGTCLNDGQGIYHPQSGTLNIKDGVEIEGYASAIEMRAGTLNITGGTFTSTHNGEFSCEKNSNGSTTIGAAIAVVQHNTELALNVNISGGTFTGVKAFAACNPQKNNTSNVKVSIIGGTFKGGITSYDAVKNFIRGGQFSVSAISNDYIVENYSENTDKNSDGYYYIVSENSIASTDTDTESKSEYYNIDLALADAKKNNKVLTVNENVEATVAKATNYVGTEVILNDGAKLISSDVLLKSIDTDTNKYEIVAKTDGVGKYIQQTSADKYNSIEITSLQETNAETVENGSGQEVTSNCATYSISSGDDFTITLKIYDLPDLDSASIIGIKVTDVPSDKTITIE